MSAARIFISSTYTDLLDCRQAASEAIRGLDLQADDIGSLDGRRSKCADPLDGPGEQAGLFWNNRPVSTAWLVVFPLLALLGQCAAWFILIRSYRPLNVAKYRVIGALEERLPASPYWRAEWSALGDGRSRATYWPLTHVEQWVPVLFSVTYGLGFVATVAF